MLNSHALILSVPVTLAAADAGAALGATPAHLAAVGGTIVALAAVVRGVDWVQNKFDTRTKAIVSAAFEVHNAHDEARFERLRGELRELLAARPRD